MTRPHLIAFTGKKYAGKGTAALPLVAAGYVQIDFADPIRAVLREIFGYTEEEMTDPVLKEEPVPHWPYLSFRHLARPFGTEVMREAMPDLVEKYLLTQGFDAYTASHFRKDLEQVWVKAWVGKVKAARAEGKSVVCTDLRFPMDEAQAIKRLGGIIVRITSDRVDADGTHASETEMDKIEADLTFSNNGSIEALQAEVRSTLLDFQPL